MWDAAANYYQKEDSWHNLFRKEVVMCLRVNNKILNPFPARTIKTLATLIQNYY